MDTHTQVPTEDLRVVAEQGAELGRFLESPGVQRALALVRAELLDEGMSGVTLTARENARAEWRGLERLMTRFQEVQNEGIVAQDIIRQRTDEEDDWVEDVQ